MDRDDALPLKVGSECRELARRVYYGAAFEIKKEIPYLAMHKRTFIRLSSATIAIPAVSRLLAWAAPDKLTNWSGNLEYSSQQLTNATSLEQVQDFVRKHDNFKVLGTRHCFNNIADSKDELLSLRQMDQVAIDPQARTVTVESGISYGKLAPQLESKGFALHNLASLPHISIAGACSTATHGSGEKNGNLSSAVSALEFVNAAGDVVRLSRDKDGETFHGAVVGLGALGVITKVTLDIQPTYHHATVGLRKSAARSVQATLRRHRSQRLQRQPLHRLAKQKILRSLAQMPHRTRPGIHRSPKDFYGATPATKNLHPIAELGAENCTEQMGVPGPWYERLPHFRMGFTPSAGKELQSEYFVPRQHAVDAILAVENLRDQITPHLLISEIRTIAADNLWMSPCYKQPCVAIHFTWKQDWPDVSKLLPVIEKELGPFQARPHWGNSSPASPAT